MGIVASAFDLGGRGAQKAGGVGQTVPIWDNGREMVPATSYERNAREGYALDELVYACIDLRCTSLGEPPVCAYANEDDDEKLDHHPAVDVLNNPNPFMGRSRFWETVGMSIDIGGNAYVEKVRAGSGKLVELWPLRADRIRVIPDSQRFIRGYSYQIGTETHFLDADDVIHFRARNPMDDYYGMATLAILAGRIDLDVWTRQFSTAFFRNAGIPAGLLNIVKAMSATDQERLSANFRTMFSGSEGWHRLLVIAGDTATYAPMGLPLGSSGVAMIDQVRLNESRILGAFGIPSSLIPTIAGSEGGSLAGGNRESDRKLFWESTLVPWFKNLDSTLTTSLKFDYPDLGRLEHDLSKVKALQEDEDKKHERWREDWKAGICTWTEVRQQLGLPAEPDEAGIVLVATSMAPTWSDEMLEEPEDPEPVMLAPGAPGAPGLPGAAPPQGALPPRQNGTAQPAANGAARY